MKLVPYNRGDLDGRAYRPCSNQKILEEFHESDMDCVEVKDFTHSSAYCCAHSLNVSIKRFGFNRIHAIARNGRVFLIKEPI